jgi:hypothetical protein
MIEKVKLNVSERKLFDAIEWDIDATLRWELDQRLANFDRVGQLTESLSKRGAIPQCRIKMFVDPEMNPGGRGKSAKDNFRSVHPYSDAEIVRMPHFPKWLRYFIEGPDLPEPTLAGFLKIVEEDQGTEGMVVDQLTKYVRKETRAIGRDHHAPREFYRLCQESERPQWADFVRKASMEASRK